jgi:2-polyprenyl-3-methyl-5-hydroxy-6-metoxy-1,4-benzoquinol methylase
VKLPWRTLKKEKRKQPKFFKLEGNTDKDYIAKNKHAWNEKTSVHVDSEFYHHTDFLEGKTSLKEIELALLGNIAGKKILHLQCHFGQDTLSLARMGADVTGIDFSDKAIAFAQKTNQELGLNAKFICCDIYTLPQHLQEQFDIVFTSYGTIGWLPDMDKWASVIAHFLKPQGQFVFVEFHPVVWMYDNHFKHIAYNYFNTEAIVEIEKGTYADKEASIEIETISWNHSLSEVIGNLMKHQIQLIDFQEYDYSPYACFQDLEEISPSRFVIKHIGNKLPMVYSLVMQRD